MSDPNSTSPDILSDGPVKYILRPAGCTGIGIIKRSYVQSQVYLKEMYVILKVIK
jgi:hypothetical protein